MEKIKDLIAKIRKGGLSSEENKEIGIEIGQLIVGAISNLLPSGIVGNYIMRFIILPCILVILMLFIGGTIVVSGFSGMFKTAFNKK